MSWLNKPQLLLKTNCIGPACTSVWPVVFRCRTPPPATAVLRKGQPPPLGAHRVPRNAPRELSVNGVFSAAAAPGAAPQRAPGQSGADFTSAPTPPTFPARGILVPGQRSRTEGDAAPHPDRAVPSRPGTESASARGGLGARGGAA